MNMKLPPLPKKRVIDVHLPSETLIYGYTAEQMQDYARDALAASRAEVEGLKKDAERYRWFRNSDEELDSYIDAAMEKGNV